MINKVMAHPHAVIFVGDSAWGAPYIIKELNQQTPWIWLGLHEEDALDATAQGNKLSDSVSKALGSQLFGHAMPYSYGLSILNEHLNLLKPLYFALSGAEYGQELAFELLKFKEENKVILAFHSLPDGFRIPNNALILTPRNLGISLEEAKELAFERLDEQEIQNIWQESRGAYETFLLLLHKALGLPPRLRPGPTRSEPPPEAAFSIDPNVLLQVLIRREQWLEAAEVAIEHNPEQIPKLLADIGNAYLERGLYQRLWRLLKQLPKDLQLQEPVLNWQLRTAKRLGLLEDMRTKIEAYLSEHDAPEIRAIYASSLAPYQESAKEAQKAYEMAKTFTTLQHHGLHLLQSNPEEGLAIFRELIELSKRDAKPLKVAQAIQMLGPPLIQLGRYNEAAYWLEEAIRSFDKATSRDWQSRMHTVNNWAYTRILIGETIGLSESLTKEEHALGSAFPSLSFIFRSTLGDYFLSQNQASEALSYYLTNLEALNQVNERQSIDFPPHVVRDVVHCYLHIGDQEKAASLARKHYYLTRENRSFERTFASFAYGMVLSLLEPENALPLLEEACRDFERPLIAPYLASACLYLAHAHLKLGDKPSAQNALFRGQLGLDKLSDTGFRVLAGPLETFQDVYQLWRGETAALSLNLLGKPQVLLHGKPLKIRPKWAEVLALLALYPEGLASERLLLELYGDEGKPATLKATLSKIRQLIPLTRPPYRLEISFNADFIDLEDMLRKGRIRASLEAYKGPLLPSSDAPGIVRARETLEESLRQAVLMSHDPEALLSLSEQLEDDMELWEAALAALPAQDPRHSLVMAKQKQLLLSWD